MLLQHGGSCQIMTSDGRPPPSIDPETGDKDPAVPPVYRQAAMPEEIEESRERDHEAPGGTFLRRRAFRRRAETQSESLARRARRDASR
jgi:hypothetical protein